MDLITNATDHLNHHILVKNKKDHHAESNSTNLTEEQLLDQQIQLEETPAAEQWRLLQTTDEMSAVMTQFNNRRALENKKNGRDSIFSSFDSILEEDTLNKKNKILSIVQVGNEREYFLQFAKTMFPDLSDLVLVLRELLKEEELDLETKKKINELHEKVSEENNASFIKAGINCALKAKLFGKSFDLAPKMLRVTYRDFLFSEDEAIDLYIRWISNFGVKWRRNVTSFIEDSLLCDICSLDPSCSKREFGYFLTKLSMLQNIKSIESIFVAGVYNDELLTKYVGDEKEWLFFILQLIKHPGAVDNIMADMLGKIALVANYKEIANVIYRIYNKIKRIPPTLFKDIEGYHLITEYLRGAIGKAFIRK